MKIFYKKLNNSKSGFTLVETLVAVFILTLAVTSLLSLTSKSLFSARYARNEITADYLLQGAADYVRNERDTIAFQQDTSGGGWNNFFNTFGSPTSSTLCFSPNGCYFDVNNNDNLSVKACNSIATFGTIKCPVFYYDPNAANGGFYNYNSSTGNLSNFKRKIYFKTNPDNPNELFVTVTVEWFNGTLVQSRSLYMSLLNWLGS